MRHWVNHQFKFEINCDNIVGTISMGESSNLTASVYLWFTYYYIYQKILKQNIINRYIFNDRINTNCKYNITSVGHFVFTDAATSPQINIAGK